MESQIVPDQETLPDVGAEPDERVSAVSQAREAINLRVLLELRRRMKSAAEKELAVGADRSRALRSELRRSEAELRLCARMMKVRAAQLGQAAERSGLTQGRASQTCARLAALARENDDLARQLSDAQEAAGRLELSVRSEQHAARGVLEAFVLATNSLMNELSLAAQDQASI